jgi:hypothetical protein
VVCRTIKKPGGALDHDRETSVKSSNSCQEMPLLVMFPCRYQGKAEKKPFKPE